MAKLKVVDKAVVISTSISFEMLKQLEAIAPELLTIKDKDGNTLFMVGTNGKATINKNGAVFSGSNKITMLMTDLENPDAKLRKKNVKEIFGACLLQLNRIEQQVRTEGRFLITDIDGMIEEIDIEDDEVIEVTKATKPVAKKIK